MPSNKIDYHSPDRMKVCRCCRIGKTLDNFDRYKYKQANGTIGFRYKSECKPCLKEYRRSKGFFMTEKKAKANRDNAKRYYWCKKAEREVNANTK